MDAFAQIFGWLARPEQKWALTKFTFGISRPGEISLALTTWQALVDEKLELVYEPLTMALWVDFGALRKEVLVIDTTLYLSYAWYADSRLYIVRVNAFGVIENRMRLHFPSVADREAFMAAMPECFRDRCKLDPKAPPPSGATVVDEGNRDRAQGSTDISVVTGAATAGAAVDSQRQVSTTATPSATEQDTLPSSHKKTVKARKRRDDDDEWVAEDESESEDDTEEEHPIGSLSETETDDDHPKPSSSQWYKKGPMPKKRRVERPPKQTTVDILQMAMGEIEDEVSAEDEFLPVSVPCVPNTKDVFRTPTHPPEQTKHLAQPVPCEATPVLPPATPGDKLVIQDSMQSLINAIEAAETPPKEDHPGSPSKQALPIPASPSTSITASQPSTLVPVMSLATASHPSMLVAAQISSRSAVAGAGSPSKHAPPATPSPAKSNSTVSEPPMPIAKRTRHRSVARPATPSKQAPPVTASPAKSTSTASEPPTPIAARTRHRSEARPATPSKQAPSVTPSPAKSTSTASEPSTPIAERTRRRSAVDAFGLSKTLTPSKRAKTPAKTQQNKPPSTPPKTPTTPKEPIMTRGKALQLGVVVKPVMEEDTKAKARKTLSKEDQFATEADEVAAAAASLTLAAEQWSVDEDAEVHQYHAYDPVDHDTALTLATEQWSVDEDVEEHDFHAHGPVDLDTTAESLGFHPAVFSDSGFIAEDDFGAAENVTLAPVPSNNDATLEVPTEGIPSVQTGLDQDKPVNAATLGTPAVEPPVDESTNVADLQPATSKACTDGTKKNTAKKASTVKNVKAAVKRKAIPDQQPATSKACTDGTKKNTAKKASTVKNVKDAVKRKAIQKTGLDQDKPVNAATLETPAVEPLLDESTTVAGEGQQPATSKACTGGSKKNTAKKSASVKNAKAVVKRKAIPDQQPATSKACTDGSNKNTAKKVATAKNTKAAAKRKAIRKKVDGIGRRLRAGRNYNLRNKKEIQRSARNSI